MVETHAASFGSDNSGTSQHPGPPKDQKVINNRWLHENGQIADYFNPLLKFGV